MPTTSADDERYMDRALALARRAAARGEVPVGAVVVRDGRVVGRGYNHPIARRDPSAHAEIVALRNAARRLDNYRLTGTTLYVVVEPCLMCMGALLHARVERLVYGAADPKVGAVSLVQELAGRQAVNHRIEVTGGVRQEACRQVLQGYFRRRR